MSGSDIGAHTGSKRIGILGGMFDPIHHGHIAAATAVQQTLGLDQVLLIPCGSPAHRPQSVASASDRCAMVAQAVAAEAHLRLDRRECESPALSYTIDTIDGLCLAQPTASWHLLLGVDAFLSLPSWKQWRRLLDAVTVVVMTRPGYSLEAARMSPGLLTQWRQRVVSDPAVLASHPKGRIIALDVNTPELSSTFVRQLIKTGADPGSILHSAVAAYIRSHGLYQSGDTA